MQKQKTQVFGSGHKMLIEDNELMTKTVPSLRVSSPVNKVKSLDKEPIFKEAELAPLPTAFTLTVEKENKRKRKSTKDQKINSSIRNMAGIAEATENVTLQEETKTADTIKFLVEVLQNHFIFFFSKPRSCKT